MIRKNTVFFQSMSSSGEQNFAELYHFFVSSVLWNCSAVGQATPFSKWMFKIVEETDNSYCITFIQGTDNLAVLKYFSLCVQRPLRAFLSLINQIWVVLQMVNLEVELDFFCVPEEACSWARNIIWCLDSQFSTPTVKLSFPFIYNWC